MAMSDNKFNVCGLKQCGDINYRLQSHYLTVNNKKKVITYTFFKTFTSGTYQQWRKCVASSYAINLWSLWMLINQVVVLVNLLVHK